MELPPAWGTFEVPAHWQSLDLISDLHLSQTTPQTFRDWAHYLEHTRADAVFILGDLFEVWPGDDFREQTFESACVQALRSASRRLTLGFMAGNRDFLVGPDLLHDCGMQRLQDPTLIVWSGQRILLTHGDALCLGDHEYQRFRQWVRTSSWASQFLSRPLPERIQMAQDIRTASQERKQGPFDASVWADVDIQTAMAWMDEAKCELLIHGHTHRPGGQSWSPTHRREVLADWDRDHSPTRAEVLRISHTGIQRLQPEAA